MNRMAEVELTREEAEIVLELITLGIHDRVQRCGGIDDIGWMQNAMNARGKIEEKLQVMQVDKNA